MKQMKGLVKMVFVLYFYFCLVILSIWHLCRNGTGSTLRLKAEEGFCSMQLIRMRDSMASALCKMSNGKEASACHQRGANTMVVSCRLTGYEPTPLRTFVQIWE